MSIDKTKFNSKRDWRIFGFGLAVILAIVASVMFFKESQLYYYFYGAAGLVALLAAVLPIVLKPIYILFSYIGAAMGWIMTRVILTILYYLILTPITLISKIVRKQFLQLDFSRKAESYWIENETQSDEQWKLSYENQF